MIKNMMQTICYGYTDWYSMLTIVRILMLLFFMMRVCWLLLNCHVSELCDVVMKAYWTSLL